jgi:prophage regulatory protein
MESCCNQPRQPELISGFLREYQIIGNRRTSSSQPMIPIDHSTLWRWVRDGHFPAPVKLGPHTTAWPVQVVREWIKSKGGA